MIKPPGEEGTPLRSDSDVAALLRVSARVILIVVVWLALFLAVFLSYVTVPLLMLLGLAVAYAVYRLVHAFRRWTQARRREEARQ